MQAVITNATAEAFFVSFMYKTLAAGESVTIADTSPEALAQETQFKKDVEAGYLTVAFAEESFDNFVPQSVDAVDIQAVAAAAAASGNVVFRTAFAAGGGGSPDDVTVVALDGLTSDMRILEAYAYVTTAVGASTLELRTEAGGGGTLLATLASATTGKKEDTTATATVIAPASSTTGLFLRRSDDGVAGEIVVVARPEA